MGSSSFGQIIMTWDVKDTTTLKQCVCVVSSSVGMLPFLVGMDASQGALTGGAVCAWIGHWCRVEVFFPFFFFFFLSFLSHLLNFHISSLQQYQFSNIFLKKFNLYFFNYYLFCFKFFYFFFLISSLSIKLIVN
jgi:hypothetical protein